MFFLLAPVTPTNGPGTPSRPTDNFDPKTMIAITLPKFSDAKGDIMYVCISVIKFNSTNR